FAGMNLIFDRVIKVGDAVMVEGHEVRVVSLNWRNMIGRKPDARIVVVPNAKLSDNTVEVLPQDEPIRIETQFSAPSDEPPQRIVELVTDLVGDLPQVDPARPVSVHPIEVAGETARYRVRCWVRRYRDMSEAEGEILLRLWYVLQRHRRAALPEGKDVGTASSPSLRAPRSPEAAIAASLEANGWPAAEAEAAAPSLAE